MLNDNDLNELRAARVVLENPSFAIRLQNQLGKPLEEGLKRLPEQWRGGINKATEAALRKALDVAAITMPDSDEDRPSTNNLFHKLLAAGSGAVGGAFGLPALAVELPVSTVIMLRSIMDIARSEGESIQDMEAKLACVEVFALSGRTTADNASEVGYYAVRAVLSQQVAELARYAAQQGLTDAGAPVLVRFIASVASRFGIVVSQKAMATAVPLIGAAGGAVVNALFIDHFQNIARAHFTIRRLERTHGRELVQEEYGRLAG